MRILHITRLGLLSSEHRVAIAVPTLESRENGLLEQVRRVGNWSGVSIIYPPGASEGNVLALTGCAAMGLALRPEAVYWRGRKAKNAAIPARTVRAVKISSASHSTDFAAVGKNSGGDGLLRFQCSCPSDWGLRAADWSFHGLADQSGNGHCRRDRRRLGATRLPLETRAPVSKSWRNCSSMRGFPAWLGPARLWR